MIPEKLRLAALRKCRAEEAAVAAQARLDAAFDAMTEPFRPAVVEIRELIESGVIEDAALLGKSIIEIIEEHEK